MRRRIAILVTVLVLIGGVLGTGVLVEASMASGSPTPACLRAEARVALLGGWLGFLQDVQATLGRQAPPALRQLIASVREQLAEATRAERIACETITSTPTVT